MLVKLLHYSFTKLLEPQSLNDSRLQGPPIIANAFQPRYGDDLTLYATIQLEWYSPPPMDEPSRTSSADPSMDTSSSIPSSTGSTRRTESLPPESPLSTTVTLLMALVLASGM